MANTRISNAIAITMLNALVDGIDTGGAGSIEIRTGSPPATCETADSGTLLAELDFGATAFGTATDGTDKATVTANSITAEASCPNPGDAGHFRVKNGSGTVILQGDVTATSGGGDMEMSNITVASGDTVSIGTSYTITLPEA